MSNRTQPRTLGQWLRYICFAAIALCLVWWMLREPPLIGKRLYKFTNVQFGISNLRNHRLKLSTIDDLNDPFDWASLESTDAKGCLLRGGRAVKARFSAVAIVIGGSSNTVSALVFYAA